MRVFWPSSWPIPLLIFCFLRVALAVHLLENAKKMASAHSGMDTTTELLNILDKAQANYERRTHNRNVQADADPNHALTDNSVTKSNALTRAHYRFGLVEKRCMEALISKLNPLRGDNLQHIELKASDYAHTFKVSQKHAYEHLSKAADALLHRACCLTMNL